MPAPVLVFDIETIPDIAGLRLIRRADPTVADAELYAREVEERTAAGRSPMLPHYLQRVLVISCALRGDDGLEVRSFVDRTTEGSSREASIIRAFFKSIDQREPQLVSWNGCGFDMPVLHYRAMKHGVAAPKYWDMGDDDREYRYNNYINRFHLRHLDLMDLLALYQPRVHAPLDVMAQLCGFPGKLGMDGSQVHAAWLEGRLEEIRRYCETDVLNTYLLYCRFQHLRGRLDEAAYEREMIVAREALAALASDREPHWREFLAAWR